jgi:hypothetical protein
MQRFDWQKMQDRYREFLAQERADTERLFIAKLLAREAAKNRHRLSREWTLTPANAHDGEACTRANVLSESGTGATDRVRPRG